MEIKRDRTRRLLTIDQSQAISRILADNGLTAANTASTPMSPSFTYGADESKILKDSDATAFRSILGSVAYISNHTRPDITCAVNTLCRYMSKPNDNCAVALKHLLRYLAGSQDLGLQFSTNDVKTLRLECFADSDWGGKGDETKGKSTSGFVCMLGGAPISWGTHLQTVVAQSSAEAELIATFESSRNVVYHRSFLEELGLHISGRTTIWEDNSACQAMSKNPVNHKRCKHILLKFYYLRDLVEFGIVGVEYISTVNQIADLFTKAVDFAILDRLRHHLVKPTIS